MSVDPLANTISIIIKASTREEFGMPLTFLDHLSVVANFVDGGSSRIEPESIIQQS
jgi:hypothetical protein